MRKKFKDTKVGKFLAEKAPKILQTVGDILPDRGALGIVKNLINLADDISPEDKEMLSQEILKLEEIELKDRESARNRSLTC